MPGNHVAGIYDWLGGAIRAAAPPRRRSRWRCPRPSSGGARPVGDRGARRVRAGGPGFRGPATVLCCGV